MIWDDYVAAQMDAIDTIRDGLGVEGGARDRLLRRGDDAGGDTGMCSPRRARPTKVKPVRPSSPRRSILRQAGDLTLFVDDEQLKMFEALSPDGFLDGRYMAATFNLLRGRDLIWNYVTNNYLLGQDYTRRSICCTGTATRRTCPRNGTCRT